MIKPINYRDAGVDISLGNKTKYGFKALAKKTFNSQVLSDLGLFGGLFAPDFKKYSSPVLVASADGVGTKLKIATLMSKHDTVGIDLVNHCANDIVVQGAKPLFFLDYIAVGKLKPKIAREIIDGICLACRAHNCALIGGETAQLPDVYHGDDYDLVGFIVGIVERDRIIDGSRIKPSDVMIGLASSGLHTNGYTLARKLLFETAGYRVYDRPPALGGRVLGNELLKPHRSYVRTVFRLMEKYDIKGMAHITGGGFNDNIVRILPDGIYPEIEFGSWTVPPIFKLLQSIGNVSDGEMRRTFNLGVGMILFVSEKDAVPVLAALRKMKEKAWLIGRLKRRQ